MSIQFPGNGTFYHLGRLYFWRRRYPSKKWPTTFVADSTGFYDRLFWRFFWLRKTHKKAGQYAR